MLTCMEEGQIQMRSGSRWIERFSHETWLRSAVPTYEWNYGSSVANSCLRESHSFSLRFVLGCRRSPSKEPEGMT